MNEGIMKKQASWDVIISPSVSPLNFRLREIWQYRDLLLFFSKKEVLSFCKETILGPIWFLIQPLLTSLVFTIIFGKIIKIPTDGIPYILFYISGIILWSFFSEVFNKTSTALITNRLLFEKVYFPRIIIPLSLTLVAGMKFLIQLILFLFIFITFYSSTLFFSFKFILLPIYVMMIVMTSLGIGLILASLTIKYKDLQNLSGFLLQGLMYATPIIYPASIIPLEYQYISFLNPLTGIVEGFRTVFLFDQWPTFDIILFPFLASIFLFILGNILFNSSEKDFVDSV